MTTAPRIFALIVAAGTGTRAGQGVPKQYRPIAAKPLLRYSCEAFLRHPSIAGVQVVIHPDHAPLYQVATSGLMLLPPVAGGAQRADSVLAGLTALAPHRPDYVLIHDAARPFLRASTIDALIAALTPVQAVLPALPMADTVRRFEGHGWLEVPREGLMRMQTPQAFPFTRLLSMVRGGDPAATDEAAIWLAAGGLLGYVPGDEELRKVTNAADIIWAERTAGGAQRTAVGMGFDVHALMPAGEKNVIRLGGIDIEHHHKLHGHSDADVVLHAIVDALLGAIGAGDIGSHFPPSDPQWQGADSALFVEEARAQVAQRGGVINHVDVTLMCEAPKISPHRDAMRAAIAAMLQLPLSRVSVKATTTEKLGFTGREEGIAAQAVATIRLPEDV
ncbi:MAG: bifunctional 2-C-methyl-D-erythritol 4-phosphate cytidylyltransferase/2-C-methyl-D-erythritol 2,4-cyclodiphosphate synthase [Pseudomonadota bacterium]